MTKQNETVHHRVEGLNRGAFESDTWHEKHERSIKYRTLNFFASIGDEANAE